MSSSESESNSEDEFKFESIIATRQRRSNAGSKLKQLLQLEEDDAESNLLNGSSVRHSNFATEDDENVELLFQEDGEDEEFVDYDEDGDDEEEEEEEEEGEDANNESESEVKKAAHGAAKEEQTETTGKNDNEEDDHENVNSDEMLSDSDISGSDTDESEGERELQKQEKLKKRKRKAADFIPTIKKPTAPTTAGSTQKPKTASPRKKPQSFSQMTTDMLLSARRSSTRKSTIANTIATAKRKNESEERRKQYAINSSKSQKVETVEKTLEEHLAEAVETERQNIESLNRFFEQEVEKKKKQRDLQNSKKRKLTEFLRFHSFGDYVTPVIELAEQKRIDDLIAKQREIELAKLKKKRKYPRKKKTLTPTPAQTPTPNPETDPSNNENGTIAEPKKDIENVLEIQHKENGEKITEGLTSSDLIGNGESQTEKAGKDIPESTKSDLEITYSKEPEQVKSELLSMESKIDEDMPAIEILEGSKTEDTQIEDIKPESTKPENTESEATESKQTKAEETNMQPVESADVEKSEIDEIKDENNTQSISLPVSENGSKITENGKLESYGVVDMKESTPTETKNGQIGKDNSTFLVSDNNTDQDADIKDTVEVKIEKMDDELSKIDGQETVLEDQIIPNEEKDNFQKVNGDADTVVPSSVDVEMVDIGEIPKESRNEEEDVNEENKSQDIKIGNTAENQEGIVVIKSEESNDSESKSDVSPAKRVTFADDTKSTESEVKAEVPVIAEENKTVTEANGTSEEKLESTNDIKDENNTIIITDSVAEDEEKAEEVVDEGPIYEGPPQFVAVNYISFEEFPNELNEDQVKEYLFSKEALLPGARRSVHVERLFTIKHDDSTSTDAKLQNSSKEREKQFKELLLLPKFGETLRTQEKEEVVEEVEEEEIKIITPSPVGIYLPDGKRKKCPISGRLAQYFDPQSGIPYNSVDSFRILRDVQDDMYYWAQIDNGGPESNYKGGIGVYMNKWNGRNAKGVPEGF